MASDEQLIDPSEALGFEFPPQTTRYTARDLSLYALGVGAATDPLDEGGLRLVYERHAEGFAPLGCYAVVPAVSSFLGMQLRGIHAPGLRYSLDRALHAAQRLELLRPLPAEATLTHAIRVKHIWDKGRFALVVYEVRTSDDDGALAVGEITTYVRGAGGFGGERGPSSAGRYAPPDREPDAVTRQRTAPNQALLYRLSGDWNPLHAEPAFARKAGFDRPILHGLCTFGFATRHVIAAFAPGGEPSAFRAIEARFTDVVFPGEELETRMWRQEGGEVVFEVRVLERDKVVIANAAVGFAAT